MSKKCPYCGTEKDFFYIPPMRKRWRQIYDLVAAAGEAGIPTEDLVEEVFGPELTRQPGAYIMLRVSVHDLNKRIEPIGQRISAQVAHGAYRLLATPIVHRTGEVEANVHLATALSS